MSEMTSPALSSRAIEKMAFPTATVSAAIIALDIYYIRKIGKSPAFATGKELISSLDPSLFYFLSLGSLTLLIAVIPLAAASIGLNVLAYKAVTKQLKRNRFIRVMTSFQRRRQIKTQILLEYARHTGNNELLEKIQNREKRKTGIHQLLPAFIIASTIILFFSSSSAHPNFIMRVCSSEIPVKLCIYYYVFVLLIIFQAILFMMVYGFNTCVLLRVNPSDFGVDKKEITQFMKDRLNEPGLPYAMKTWLGRRNPSKIEKIG